MILDKDVTGARFIENITALREHPEDLQTMEKSIGTLKKCMPERISQDLHCRSLNKGRRLWTSRSIIHSIS